MQVGETRQREKLITTCPNVFITTVNGNEQKDSLHKKIVQGRGGHFCLPPLHSTPLPHFILQTFSAGASLSARSVGSIIYRLFVGVAVGHIEMDTSFTTDFIPSPPC